MDTQASQFAQELERIGRQALEQCQGVPDVMLQWPVPLREPCSLLTLALQLARAIDDWILIPMSGRHALQDCPDPYHICTFAELNIYYEAWITDLHNSLDTLPNAFLNLFTDVSYAQGGVQRVYQRGATSLTFHRCLLKALTSSAEQLGQIVFIRRLFDDGDWLFQKVQHEIIGEMSF